MIKILDQLELSFLFKLKVIAFSNEEFYKEVLCQSKNFQFLAFKYNSDLYLVEKSNKTLLHLHAEIFDCCFSDDSKYFAVCQYSQEKLLMLYNLFEKKKVFLKKIEFEQTYTIKISLKFYKHLIFLISNMSIEVYSLKGEERFQLKRDIDLLNFHIKLNDKILVYSNDVLNHYKTDFSVFSTQSLRNLKKFSTYQRYLDVFNVSEYLLFQVPLNTEYILILRQLISSKIVRKYKQPRVEMFRTIYRKKINNHELLAYQVDGYFKISITKGTTQFFYFKFPNFVNLMRVETLIEPIFIECKELKVWEKHKRKRLLQFNFYELKI